MDWKRRSALIMLMVLLGGYAAFTWWVRPDKGKL